ncbi:hypothetical protein F4806DRAFT_499742 [Annulohypoxylon nitens]|nr:hypothetical protein F4806DRAFT_499742 [Annulohypoxylon nitens]
MPENVKTAPTGAIKGRKCMKDFFRSANLSSEQSMQRHGYFIEVLERAAALLLKDNTPSASTHEPPYPLATPCSDVKEGWQVVRRKRRH